MKIKKCSKTALSFNGTVNFDKSLFAKHSVQTFPGKGHRTVHVAEKLAN